MPGMAMSSSSRSGRTASAMRSAASPSAAVPTRVTPSDRARSSVSRSTASGSSSTTRTRSTWVSVMADDGHDDMDGISPFGIGPVEASRLDAVPGDQTLAHILETDAGAAAIVAAVRWRHLAIVLDLEVEPAGFFISGDAHRHRAARARHPAFDRILADRLEEEDGNADAGKVLGYIHFDLQPIGETHLLDIEVEALQLYLLLQRDVGGGVGGESGAIGRAHV